MTDLVKCDRCGTPFSIQTAGIRSTWSGDYMVQYFTCPGCHHRYQILTTDTELRQLFREYISFMTESEHNNELLFREVIRFQTEKGADHEKE